MANGEGFTKRNIWICLFLIVITGGIYGLYWLYCMGEELRELSGEPRLPRGGTLVLLTVVTLGIYHWYWIFVVGEWIEKVRASRNLPLRYSGILYMGLSIIGLSVAAWMLLQNEMNRMIGE